LSVRTLRAASMRARWELTRSLPPVCKDARRPHKPEGGIRHGLAADRV
jgi:hypothetical protein